MTEAISSHKCAHCGKYKATWRAEVQGPDDSYTVYRYWCDAACHANWGCNIPVKQREK